MAAARAPRIEIHPATPGRWPDVVALFGPRGACAGCWCMWPRKTAAGFRRDTGERNRRSLHRLVARGAEPGLIAYAGGEPVGWCAVAPRAEYVRLETSRVLAPVDDRPVWSVVCFFVARGWRGRGITVRLLREAAAFAAARGAKVLEGYPNDPKSGTLAPAFAWHGLAAAFLAAGFREVARRSPTRPIMRRTLRAPRGKSRG